MPESLKMKQAIVGDIVSHNDARWVVRKCNRGVRTVKVENWERETAEIPNEPNIILVRPSLQWPFVSMPIRQKGGPVIRITRSGAELEPLVDWAPSSRLRSGGTIFFSPTLRLRKGEVLVAHHKEGVLSRIDITPGFGTFNTRKRRSEYEEPQPRTAAQRIMGNEDLFEEFDE